MKRRIGAGVGVLLLLALLMGLAAGCKRTDDYRQYFKNYTSRGAYTRAELVLQLPQDTYVDSYDPQTGYYVVRRTYTPYDVTLYGVASEAGMLTSISYTSILSLRADYAICTRLVVEGGIDTQESRVGVVRLTPRPMEQIESEGLDPRFGFSYDYAPAVSQYQFAGPYLVVHGTLGMDTDQAGRVRYATLYDLTLADVPVEKGRVGDVMTFHNHFSYGHYLLSTNGNSLVVSDLNTISADGYFVRVDEYKPFNDADNFEEAGITVRPYYLGNDWFLLTGTYTSSSAYDGYEIREVQDGEYVYMTMRSVKYNARTHLTYPTYRVVTVANAYHDNELGAVANALNWSDDYLTDSVGTRLLYQQPVVNPAGMVQPGYSLAYYYYFAENQAMVSFELLDANANSVNLDNLFMPLLYVDGVGLQNSDPTFSIPVRAFDVYDYQKGKMRTLLGLEGSVGYDPVVSFGGAVIGGRFDVGNGSMLMGALDAGSGKQLVPFRYYELTPFFGQYATASQFDTATGDAVRHFYRVGRDGTEREILNVYGLYNGVYLTRDSAGNMALAANDGTVLIPTASLLNVVQSYLQADGSFIATRAYGVVDGHGAAWRLE